MKTCKWLPLLLLFVTLAAACRQQPDVAPTVAAPDTPTEAAEPPTAAVATAEAATAEPPTEAAPTEAATPTPTAVPAEATEEVAAPDTAFCAVVDPTLIDLNTQGLFTGWQADCVAGGEYTADGPAIVGLPEHIQISFDGSSSSAREPGEPVIYVIPAGAYRALWDEAGNPLVGEQLDALHNWIGRQLSAVPTQNVPVLPIEEAGATNDLAVQGRYLDFGEWDGFRFVGRFAQDANPVTNENLRYIFQGFAGPNDEVLVAAFFPVSTPYLPATFEEVSAEELDVFEADPPGAINLAAVELNVLTAADWQPALNLLDELVGSLQYGGTETPGESEAFDPTPEAIRPSSYAVVTGASGVNIRTGPSTAFPSLGVAPFGTELELIGRSVDNAWWVTPVQGAPNGRGWVSAGFVEAFGTGALPIYASPPLPPMPTPLPTAAPTPAAPSIAFWVDRSTINQGECTTLRWSVANIQAVWVYPVGENFQNFPATGDGSRQVCPTQTTTYEMRVQLRDNSITTQQVTVSVNPGNPLVNTNWVLSSFAGEPLLPGAPPTIAFGTSNYVSGFGGCNTFGGNYSVFDGGGLAISVGTRSLAACEEDVMAQEARYLSALQGAGGYTINGNQLTLRDSAGVETLWFLRQ